MRDLNTSAMSRRLVFRIATAGIWLLAIPGCAGSASLPLYDTHAHFFSADTARYPQDLRGAREGEDHLRARIQEAPNTPERVLPVWEANGVEGGVAVQYAEVYKRDNSFVLDSGDRFPEKIAVVVILDPLSPESPDQLRRLVREHGVSGVRLTGGPADGSYPWLAAPGTQALWQVADELRLAVVVMPLPSELSVSALEAIAANAARFPNAQVVLDHVGWGRPGHDLDVLKSVVGKYENVSFKLTTVNLDRLHLEGDDAPAYVRQLVDLFGAGRVMWGSDFGRTPLPYSTMVDRLNAATIRLEPAERRSLMHDTGARVFRRQSPVRMRKEKQQ